MTCSSSSYRGDGFTLIELLTSIFIFSVVVTSVYGSYRATFHTVNGTEKQVVLTSEARVVLERLTADLESMYAGEGGFLEGTKGDIGGNRGDSLSCTSSAHLLFNRNERQAGLTILRYTTEEDESGRINLYRADAPVLPGENESEEEKGLLLARGLLSFQITYVTAEGDERDDWESEPPESQEGGEGQSAAIELPALIRVQIRMGEKDSTEEQGVVFKTAVAIPRVPSEEKEE